MNLMPFSAFSFVLRAIFEAKLMNIIARCRWERQHDKYPHDSDEKHANADRERPLPSLDDWERLVVEVWIPKCLATVALLYLMRRRRNVPLQVTQTSVSYDSSTDSAYAYNYAYGNIPIPPDAPSSPPSSLSGSSGPSGSMAGGTGIYQSEQPQGVHGASALVRAGGDTFSAGKPQTPLSTGKKQSSSGPNRKPQYQLVNNV